MYETFSFRQKQSSRNAADVYRYDELPSAFRVQAARIWEDALNAIYDPMDVPRGVFLFFHDLITTELGVFGLSSFDNKSRADIVNYFVQASFDEALDVLEMMFVGMIQVTQSKSGSYRRNRAEDVISLSTEELNRRFMQHGVGYAFVIGSTPQIIRRDSEHLHSEAVVPALMLLSEQRFEGANDEYRKAHQHYRDGNQKECLNECLKAFESTLKTICGLRKWSYQQTDTAKTLINIVLKNNLLPLFMQSHLGAVQSALESAIPTVRNKMGGHGQGQQPTKVPAHYAEYLLHETAATIVFLVDAFKALP
jgi:hypothetical protein